MKKYLITFLIISGIILPAISFAAMPDFNGPLVICGREGQDPCTLCDVFKMAQKMIDFITGLIFIIAPILIAVGGFMILVGGANPGTISTAKKIITNVVIGIIIAFLAWTVINMIFNGLVSKEKGKFPGPWNEINCSGGGINKDGTPSVEEGKYCVCETPVYDLKPTDAGASQIGTNAKVYIHFANKEECLEKCVSANASTYCHSSLKMDAAKLYCSDDAGLKNTSACTLNKTSSSCQIGNCSNIYNSTVECYNAIRDNFKSKCYVDGQIMCECFTASQKGVCDKSPNKYVPWQTHKESTIGSSTSLFNCGGTSSTYCRINCDYQKCGANDGSNKWCTRTAPSGSDKWILSGIKSEQKGDASSDLTSFLNCMYFKIPSGLTITSISDDKACSGSCTPSTGSGCSHTANSCHYGGSKCTGYSYAVDFATNVKCSKIRTAALQCNIGAWVNWEDDHTHVSINNTNCGCAESGSGNSCSN